MCSANHRSFCFVFLTSPLLPLGHRVTLFVFPNQHSPTSTYALTKALLQVEPYSCVTEEQRRNNFSLFQLSCPSLHKHGSTHIPVNSAFCFHSCWLLLLFFFLILSTIFSKSKFSKVRQWKIEDLELISKYHNIPGKQMREKLRGGYERREWKGKKSK